MIWGCGGIGRHNGLKIRCSYEREGSSPSSPTIIFLTTSENGLYNTEQEERMKIGDLVRIKRGRGKGKLAVVAKVSRRIPISVRCFHSWNRSEDKYGYYREDLEVL
jgi:hypothetical protein